MPGGDEVRAGGEWRERKAAEYFYGMFPMGHLPKIVALTNVELLANHFRETTAGEILRFFGVLILISRFEFGDTRRNLWKKEADSKYIPAPNLGRAMSRRRFEEVFKCIRYSAQPIGLHGSGLSSAEYRWALMNDFLRAINEHRERTVTPSETICVDESMVRWYGLGGNWIDKGLPMYISIDRKPENGCELQTAACGTSGIMLRMEVVTTAEDESKRPYEDLYNHGTAVLRRLVEPWAHSGRHVVADSYFSSVQSAKMMLDAGLQYTGVVKTATREYPMQALSTYVLAGRGEHICALSDLGAGRGKLMALAWVDRNRRYFLSTCGRSSAGAPYRRIRWRQTSQGPRREEIVVQQPRVVEHYYGGCAAIDQHNRHRQDTLSLERKIEVKGWDKRVNIGLLAVCIVDSWLLYKGGRGAKPALTQNRFYERLAEELVENTYDGTPVGGKRRRIEEESWLEAEPIITSGRGEHLTPTKRMRRAGGALTGARAQGRCAVCSGFKSKFICSCCRDASSKEVFLCHSQTGRTCFAGHLSSAHGLE